MGRYPEVFQLKRKDGYSLYIDGSVAEEDRSSRMFAYGRSSRHAASPASEQAEENGTLPDSNSLPDRLCCC